MLNGGALRKLIDRSDGEIADRLFIVPFFDHQLQIQDGAASIDLRLGSRFAVAKRRRLTHIDLYSKTKHPTAKYEEHYVPLGNSFVIHPGHFVLASTLEWLRLPPRIGAYVVGKLTLGRFGLNITTGAGVQPGFAGALTLELANFADVPIELIVGQPICQVFFHIVNGDAPGAQEHHQFSQSICSRRPTFGLLRTHDVDTFLGIPPQTGGNDGGMT